MSGSGLAIRVEGLGKTYELRHERSARYTTLRDVIARKAKDAGRGAGRLFGGGGARAVSRESFDALSDVSFEIRAGERVGVIGRNGAGKSTLLKLLSRITEPTRGRIGINGRVASLLEVGTGFHPELTGRENIFLNGSILGMRRVEISHQFDEIVAFAEIEKFLDTPVKRYSSGMYVRLAFAVAASLETEILLVDEVLAVGDAAFQKKCVGRMAQAGGTGKTVLFVSHNMGLVSLLCGRGIYLREGRVAHDGPIDACVKRYVEDWSGGHGRVVDLAACARPAQALRQAARLARVGMQTDGNTPWQVPFSETPTFLVEVGVTKPLPLLELGVALMNSSFVEIATSLSSDALPAAAVEPGSYQFRIALEQPRLLPGTYALGLGLRSGFGDLVMEDYLPEAAFFEVLPDLESARLAAHTRRGAVIPRASYELKAVSRGAAGT